jgi:hypothetical protein
VVHGLLKLISPTLLGVAQGGAQRRQPVYSGIVLNDFNFFKLEGDFGYGSRGFGSLFRFT